MLSLVSVFVCIEDVCLNSCLCTFVVFKILNACG